MPCLTVSQKSPKSLDHVITTVVLLHAEQSVTLKLIWSKAKKKVFPGEIEGDLMLPGAQRTALVLQSIANSIFPSTQMEIVALLDLDVREREDNGIDNKWYGKEVSKTASQ